MLINAAPVGLRFGAVLRTALFYGFPAAIAATSLAAVFVLYFPAPQADYWDHIHWLRLMRIDAASIFDLFRQANEHRIAAPRLAFLLDDALVASTGVICIAATLASAAGLAALFASAARRDLAGDDARFLIFLAICFGFLFNQYENFLWENQVQFLFVYLFAAVGAYCALNDAEQGGGGLQRWAAVAATLTATCSMANGVLIYIALAMGLALIGRRRQALWWLTFGAAVLAVYLIGYVHPAHHANPAAAFDKLGLVLTHFQITLTGLFAGTGIQESGLGGAALVGGAGGYLALRMAAIALGRHKPSVGETLFIVMALHVIGSCLITSAGRADIDVGQGAASRYQTPVNLFWLSILALLVYDPLLARAPGRRGAPLAAAVCFAVLFAGAQWTGWRKASLRALELGVAADALIVGAPDKTALTALFPDPDVPSAYSDILKAEQRSLFAAADDDALAAGRKLDDAAPLASLGTTAAVFTKLAADGVEGLRLTARLDDLAGSSMGRRVTITDACGRIVGYGRVAAAATRQESKARLVFNRKPGYLTAYILPANNAPNCPQASGDALGDYRLSVGRP